MIRSVFNVLNYDSDFRGTWIQLPKIPGSWIWTLKFSTRPPRDDATDSRWLWISDSKDPYIPQGRTWLCHRPDSTDVQINSTQNCTTIIFCLSRSCKNLTTKNPSTQDHASDTPNHGPLVQNPETEIPNLSMLDNSTTSHSMPQKKIE